MLLINCPWCGPRDETEFHYGSEAHIGYPEKPEELTDKQWAEYIFYRNNNKGWRIDYINVSEPLRDRIQAAAIYPEAKHSDHCPVMLTLS